MEFEDKIQFNASPHEIYELIIDEKKHREFSNAYVEIDRKTGGKYNCYNSIFGEIISLEQGRKIIYTWRGNDWLKGHYATVYFAFKEIPERTLIEFKLKDIPDIEPFCNIDWKAGWEAAYWKPIRE
ncbi:MAG: SRPBCC domain-containing protein [Candidatus Thorarchaeota archaeon]